VSGTEKYTKLKERWQNATREELSRLVYDAMTEWKYTLDELDKAQIEIAKLKVETEWWRADRDARL
jgi:hypothetical protein